MKNKKIYLFLIGIFSLFLPYSVNAGTVTKLQCNYKGYLPSYDDTFRKDGVEMIVTLKLVGEQGEGKNGVFSSSLYLANDYNIIEERYDACKAGKTYNGCIELYVSLECQKDYYQDCEKINYEKWKITFGEDKKDSSNDIVNVLITNSNNKYEVFGDDPNENDKSSYFVKNGKYTCPDSLVALSNSDEIGSTNYSFYLDPNGFDTSKCENNLLNEHYLCNDTYEVFKKYENKNKDIVTIETDYDDGVISGGYGECCVYTNPSLPGKELLDSNIVYVYKYGLSAGGKNQYAACAGDNCMTLDPTLNLLLNNDSWSKAGYHNLSDCSNMPSEINFTYNGADYTRVLNNNITCSVPKSTPSDLNTTYNSAKFFVKEKNNSNGNGGSGNDYNGIDWGESVPLDCEGIFGDELLDFFGEIFKWIRIIAPIIVILLSSVEFAGALLQDDRDALKKASNRFVKRLIIAVALFFVPIILEFVLNVFNEISKANTDICGIGK